ncbi:hypothetical protein Syun_027119 [Stephania yunnanensis]|uniref:Secreted protein n=1 Tax=Stephania yunnanensis TaxID=152371 RepID=A0AAP0EKI9_9MAGN
MNSVFCALGYLLLRSCVVYGQVHLIEYFHVEPNLSATDHGPHANVTHVSRGGQPGSVRFTKKPSSKPTTACRWDNSLETATLTHYEHPFSRTYKARTTWYTSRSESHFASKGAYRWGA